MPTTVNGVGTHYYGKKNRQTRVDHCRSCGQAASLESYDTRLWFVVIYIPLIPLGRKRIIDQCSQCSRHYVVEQDTWEMSKQLGVSGSMEKYRADPSPETALEVHGQLLQFHLLDDAKTFRAAAVEQFADNPVLLAGLGSHAWEMGQYEEATTLFQQAFDLRPDLPEARIGLAQKRMGDDELDEARELLDFLEKPGASQLYDLGVLEILAQLYQQNGKHAETLELCKHLLAEFPHVAENRDFRKFVAVSEKALGESEGILPKRDFSIRDLFDTKSGKSAPWQRWAVFGTVAVTLVLIGLAVNNEYRRRHRALFVLNDLGQPVQLQLDDREPVSVDAETQIEVAEGKHHAKISGPISEEFDFEVRSGYFARWTKDPVWLINVGGQTALLFQTVFYAVDPPPSEGELLVGQRFLDLPDVDHLFEEAPNSLELPSETSTAQRTQLTCFDFSPLDLFHYLMSGETTAAFDFAEIRLQVEPANQLLLDAYVEAINASDRGEHAERFLRAGLWRDPISIHWHRAYQHLDSDPTRDTKLLEAYDAELRKEPQNAPVLYLKGRFVEGRAASEELFHKATDADPKFPWPWLGLAYSAASQSDWQTSRSHAEKAIELGLDDLNSQRIRHAACLGLEDTAALEAEYREGLKGELSRENVFSLVGCCDVLAKDDRMDEARQVLADWETQAASNEHAHLAGVIRLMAFYILGDFDCAELIEDPVVSSMAPEFQVHMLLAMGLPQDVAENPALEKALREPVNAMALSLAFSLSGNEPEATTWRDHACTTMERKGCESRQVAAILRALEAPSMQQLDEIVMTLPEKSLLMAILAARFPERKAEFLAVARRLNVSRFPPYHIIRQATEPEP